MTKTCTFVLRGTLMHHRKGVNQIIRTKDGYLISVGDDKLLAVMIWNASSKFYEVIAKATCTNKAKTVEYDYIRRRIYVGCFLGTVDVFELTPTLELKHKSSNKWHTRECSAILYLPHHNIIMTAGFDRRLLFYDCVANKVLCSYIVSSEFIRHIYYDDVGGKLYLGTHEGLGIPVFNLEEPREVVNTPPVLAFRLGNDKKAPNHTSPVRWIDFDPVSRYMFTCDHSGKILIFQAGEPGNEVPQPPIGQLVGHKGGKIRRVLWSDSSKLLYSCGKDMSVCVWDVLSSASIGSIHAHADEVMGMLFMDQDLHHMTSLYDSGKVTSTLLLTWGKDACIKLWNVVID